MVELDSRYAPSAYCTDDQDVLYQGRLSFPQHNSTSFWVSDAEAQSEDKLAASIRMTKVAEFQIQSLAKETYL